MKSGAKTRACADLNISSRPVTTNPMLKEPGTGVLRVEKPASLSNTVFVSFFSSENLMKPTDVDIAEVGVEQ